MPVVFKYTRLDVLLLPERIWLQKKLWSLWSTGTQHCFIWGITLHANLHCFLKNFPFFFFPLPQQNKALKGKHSFLAIDIIRSQYFWSFFVGSVVKITNLLCCGISVMCFYKNWPKLSFWLEEIFSHAVYWIPNSSASNFVGENGEPDTRCSQ